MLCKDDIVAAGGNELRFKLPLIGALVMGMIVDFWGIFTKGLIVTLEATSSLAESAIGAITELRTELVVVILGGDAVDDSGVVWG